MVNSMCSNFISRSRPFQNLRCRHARSVRDSDSLIPSVIASNLATYEKAGGGKAEFTENGKRVLVDIFEAIIECYTDDTALLFAIDIRGEFPKR